MRKSIGFILLIVLLVISFLGDVLIGSEFISISQFVDYLFGKMSETDVNKVILTEFRIPKALTAVLTGAALSVSGLLMQTVFRNPLAGPYILGVSSGAGLGVALVVLAGISVSFISVKLLLIFAACLGAAFVLMLILLVSSRVKDIMTLLILGILFSSVITAVVSILQYLGSESALKTFVLWTLGSLSGVTKDVLFILIPVVVLGLLLSFFAVKSLNVLALGESYARSLGVNPLYSRILIFTATGILAGSITAFCGPIGFVGIVIPHFARMLFKYSDHLKLIPISIVMGSTFMLLSDIISQLPGTAMVLPINSVTAILGIPGIIYIIVKRQKIAL